MILQVQKTGTYKIVAAGASGGGLTGAIQTTPPAYNYPAVEGGSGSVVTMTVKLQANDTIIATVGKTGVSGSAVRSNSGGGGATVVSKNGWYDILAVGAGGAGRCPPRQSTARCASTPANFGDGGLTSSTLPAGSYSSGQYMQGLPASFFTAPTDAPSARDWIPGSEVPGRGPECRYSSFFGCSGGGAGYIGGAPFQGGAPFVHADALSSTIAACDGEGYLNIEFVD